MTTPTEEITDLRAALESLQDWALRAAAVCRDPIEQGAWFDMADMAKKGLRTPRASVVREVPRQLTWMERLSGKTRP